MTKNIKLLGAIAVAGVVAATGSAFTGTGLSTTGSAGSAQYVGGTVDQSVTGGTLSSVAYGFVDTTNTAVNEVTLTFADTNTAGKTPSITLAGGTPISFLCEQIVETTGTTSICSPADGASQSGVTSIAVTV